MGTRNVAAHLERIGRAGWRQQLLARNGSVPKAVCYCQFAGGGGLAGKSPPAQ